GRRRAIGEYVAEVTAAARAVDFRALHQEAVVGRGRHGAFDRRPETRPTRAALELRGRRKHRQIAAGAMEGAGPMLVEQRAGAGRLGALFAQDIVLRGREQLAPFISGVGDFERGRVRRRSSHDEPVQDRQRQDGRTADEKSPPGHRIALSRSGRRKPPLPQTAHPGKYAAKPAPFKSRWRDAVPSALRLDLGNGGGHQLLQPGPAALRIGDQGRAHARFPELLQMVGNAVDGLVAGIGGEEAGDLVRHVNHVLRLHWSAACIAWVMRSGWVTTRTLSGRASATSVRLQASATRPARAVGAEMATSTGMPAAAAFCTISTLQRLVMRAKPSAASRPRQAMAPISLSSALWRPTSSRANWIRPALFTQAAAWTERVSWLTACCRGSSASAA